MEVSDPTALVVHVYTPNRRSGALIIGGWFVTRYVQDAKSRVALSSIVASLLLLLFKLIIGLATNSLGILSEALHSGIDIIAAGMTLFAVRMSLRTPDLDHPYGYFKFESLASLIEILLLFAVAGGILYEGLVRIFFQPSRLSISVFSFAVIIISIVVDFGRSRALYRVSRRFGSQALEADSLHFRADMITSAVVLFGLFGVAFFDVPNADAYAAIVASATMVFTSLGLGRRTMDVLLDKAPKGVLGQVEESVSGLTGVSNVSNVRVRKVGPQTFVDLHIEVPRTYTNDRAHDVATLVEEKLRRILPNSDILVHVDAVELKETLIDKIRLIAAETEGIKNVHSVYQSSGPNLLPGKFHVYLDVQMDERLDLPTAHALIDGFEKRLTTEIPEIQRVTTHQEVESGGGGEIGAEQIPDQALVKRVRDLALTIEGVKDSREVAVITIKGEKHITLTLTIAAGKNLALEDAHRIATSVQNLLVSRTGASRVVAHVEPAAE